MAIPNVFIKCKIKSTVKESIMKAKLGGTAAQVQFDLFIKSNHEFLESNINIRSGYAGLFWFSDDYQSIEDVRGIREFTNCDILTKRKVEPDGSHSDHRDLDLRRPKGRVTLMPDGVVINVGLRCPDSVIALVKEKFELNGLEPIVRVNRGSHWDSKS